MIIDIDGVWPEIDDARVCVIHGRLGAGKTLMAMEIAQRYLQRGYRLVTNVRCVWADDPDDVDLGADGALRAVVIVDEGGLYLRTQEQASALSSYARKLDCYVVICGRKLPHADLCPLSIHPWANLAKWLGLPVKLWRYDYVSGPQSYHGYIAQVGWWAYYGVYDTIDPAGDPREIIAWIADRTRQLHDRYSREYTLSAVGSSWGPDHDAAAELADAARALQRAVSVRRRSWR